MAEERGPLERRTWAAQRLFDEHPPVIHDGNKRAVLEIACPEGARHGGEVVFTRWGASTLPEEIAAEAAASCVVRHDGFFDYAPALPGAVEWHVNFADPHLFFAYGGGLFAQDEMQVAEHPVLGALREALEAGEGTPLTVEGREPTPVLVAGGSSGAAASRRSSRRRWRRSGRLSPARRSRRRRSSAVSWRGVSPGA